jgi:hypothetical protein
MAPTDPPIAEAHVAIGIMPAFFAENPRQWFQTAEAHIIEAYLQAHLQAMTPLKGLNMVEMSLVC